MRVQLNDRSVISRSVIAAVMIAAISLSTVGTFGQDLVPTSSLTGGSSIFVFRKTAVRQTRPPARAERSKTQQLASIAKVKRQYDTIARTAPKRDRETVVDPNKLPKNYRTLPAAQGSKLFAGVGEYYLDRNETDKAEEFFRDAVSLDESNSRARSGLADTLVRRGNDLLVNDKSSEARAFFAEALKLDPNNAGATYGLGEILVEEGKLDDAIASYERSLKIDKDLTEIFVPLGILYYQTGQIAKADDMLTKAIRVSPDSAETQFFFGLVRAVQGKDSEALAAFDATVKIDPQYADAYFNIGELRSRRSEFDAAIAAYKKALELKPSYFEALVGLAEAYFDKGDDTNAIEEFTKASKLKNDRWQVFAGLAESLRRARRYNEAAMNYILATVFLKRDPASPSDLIAEYYSKAGFSIGMQCEINMQQFRACDWATAVKHLESAVEISKSPYDYANLGWAYYNAARTDLNLNNAAAAKPKLDAAKTALERALAGDPAIADGVNQNLGAVLIDQGDFKGAVDALKKVADRQPTWIFSRYALGTAYFRLNDFDNAAKAFRSALAIDPRHVPSLMSLGFTEIRRKKGDEVRKIIEQLKTLSPSDAQRLDRDMKLARL